MQYLVENPTDLERLVSSYLSEPKQNGEVEHYLISWDTLANVLKTSDRIALTAWVNEFAQRANLICSPALDGVNFTPIKPPDTV